MNPEIWVILPSANPKQAAITLPKWTSKGYKVCVMLDSRHLIAMHSDAYAGCETVAATDLEFKGYLGYPWAINALVDWLDGVDLFWAIGDDMHPPHYSAAEMSQRFRETFPDGMGMYQGTGDKWAPDDYGVPASARICGSPIFGRKLAESMYGGLGPFCPDYYHFFADEEAKNVTEQRGILFQDPTCEIYHDHWHRRRDKRPEHMAPARDSWAKDKATFERRKAAGFPGVFA